MEFFKRKIEGHQQLTSNRTHLHWRCGLQVSGYNHESKTGNRRTITCNKSRNSKKKCNKYPWVKHLHNRRHITPHMVTVTFIRDARQRHGRKTTLHHTSIKARRALYDCPSTTDWSQRQVPPSASVDQSCEPMGFFVCLDV